MKKEELFKEVLSLSSRIAKEYKEYVDYCVKNAGVKYVQPKDKMGRDIEMMIYLLKRNSVINKSTIQTMAELAKANKLPPPKEQ